MPEVHCNKRRRGIAGTGKQTRVTETPYWGDFQEVEKEEDSISDYEKEATSQKSNSVSIPTTKTKTTSTSTNKANFVPRSRRRKRPSSSVQEKEMNKIQESKQQDIVKTNLVDGRKCWSVEVPKEKVTTTMKPSKVEAVELTPPSNMTKSNKQEEEKDRTPTNIRTNQAIVLPSSSSSPFSKTKGDLQQVLEQMPKLESMLSGIHAALLARKELPHQNLSTNKRQDIPKEKGQERLLPESPSKHHETLLKTTSEKLVNQGNSLKEGQNQLLQEFSLFREEQHQSSLTRVQSLQTQLACEQKTNKQKDDKIRQLQSLLKEQELKTIHLVKEHKTELSTIQLAFEEEREKSRQLIQERDAKSSISFSQTLPPKSITSQPPPPPDTLKKTPPKTLSAEEISSNSSSRRRRSKGKKRRKLSDYVPPSFDSLAGVDSLLRSPPGSPSNNNTAVATSSRKGVITIDTP
jgi:hypothetical protein